MKSLFLRTGVALACALTLASCGGKGGSLALGGTVYGLSKTGLVLLNNGGDETAVEPSTSSTTTTFYFKSLIGNDADYNVTVKSSPSSAVCTATEPYNKGRSSTFDVITIVINCITNTYDLGGTVNNLKGQGLVLVNGQDRVAVSPASPSFTFTRDVTVGTTTTKAGKVGDGSPYGVTVLTQPSGQTCTVSNGVGTMGAAAVNNVQVDCI